MLKSHYFVSPVEVYEQDKLSLILPRALVSRKGIYRVFEESEETYKAFLEGRIFSVYLQDKAWLGRLIREQGESGSHYNLHLLHDESDQQTLDEILSRIGFGSPWKRRFPRIPLGAVTSDTEKPDTLHFPRVVGHAMGLVRNFSVHGLLFEFSATGMSIGEYIGQKVRIDITTNRRRTIRDIEAKIMRIYDEMLEPGRMVRGVGLKFLHMPEDSEAAYHNLILGVCEEIRKDL